MGKPSKQILDFMEKYGVESDEIWEVQGKTWVVLHRALERVAADVGIEWDRPAVLECNSANGVAALVVFGQLGARKEWSIGEALVVKDGVPGGNYKVSGKQPGYVYAMAEKRAKDRVILKLLNAHGALYSEEEADEFAQGAKRPNPHVTRAADIVPSTEYDDNGNPIDNIPHPDPSTVRKLRVADQRPVFEALQNEIHATGSVKELQAWADTNKDRLGDLKADWQEFLRGVYAEHLQALRTQEQGDNRRMAS